MKHIKKFAALALAIMMLMGLATTAFAANTAVPGPFDVIINNAEGHEYVIYQIFTGDLSKNEAGTEVLSNLKFGADYLPDSGKVDEFGNAIYYTTTDKVPQSILDAVNANPNSIIPTGAGTEMTTSGTTASITVEKAGYYMIKDVTETLPGQDTRSAVIFQVVGDTEVTSKHTGTTIVKKVQDINDSTGEQPKDGESVWIDSADYDIGDTVPFQSTVNYEGLDNYTSYKIIITDIMAPGLKYNGDMAISLNGNPVGNVDPADNNFVISVVENYTEGLSTDDPYYGGTKITITCNNLKAHTTENSATIVLNYSATLDTDAKFGAPGNPNKIRATTNHDGTGETPWDVNIVFTYKLESNKYAEEVKTGNELTGAGFTLFKWIKDNSEAGGYWDQIGEEVEGEAMTKFEWKGIDDGKYKLVETTTPAGYNTIDPIEFEVTAEHDIVSASPELTDLTGTKITGEVNFTASASSGLVSTNVVNKSGIVLPETGGTGTTLFYIMGGAMVLVAAILLVTKKRMSNAD